MGTAVTEGGAQGFNILHHFLRRSAPRSSSHPHAVFVQTMGAHKQLLLFTEGLYSLRRPGDKKGPT